MAKHSKTAKVNIPMCIASFLFCLTLISVHLMSGLYAKYISSGSGRDSAKVITFGDITLTETGDFEDGNAYIIPGVDLKKKAVVDFAGSEAATYVFVEITTSAWQRSEDKKSFSVPLSEKNVLTWSVADGWQYLDLSETKSGTYVYYRELAPNTKPEKVDIIAADGAITVSEDITRTDMSEIRGLSGLYIKLRATVVQSGGFADVSEAWASISAKGDETE